MRDSDILCYAVKSKTSEEVIVDFMPIIRGFLSACPEGEIETRSVFSTYGESVYVIFRVDSSSLERCGGVAEALLSALLPETLTYKRVSCEKLFPFPRDLYTRTSQFFEEEIISY